MKFTTLALVVMFVAAPVLLVHAQTTTPTSTEPVATTTEEVVVEAAEPVPVVTTPTPSAASALSPEKQKRILNLAANMSNRVDAAADRLDHIAKRLRSRIQKTEANGANVILANAAMRQVESNLAHTKSHISDIDTVMFNTVTAANPKEVWSQTRLVFQESQIHLHEIRAGLRLVLETLKQAIIDHETKTDTPTETSTSSDELLLPS